LYPACRLTLNEVAVLLNKQSPRRRVLIGSRSTSRWHLRPLSPPGVLDRTIVDDQDIFAEYSLPRSR
jgi:hypothetical protein